MNLSKISIAMIALLMTAIMAGSAEAAKQVQVVLKGQIKPITGYLREASPARYLLQSEGQLYQFGADELVSVEGNNPSLEDLGRGRLVSISLYEKILPNGDVEIWSNLDVENKGSGMIESVDWGAAEWEMEDGYSHGVYDQFGTSLPVDIEPNGQGAFRVSVKLPVPVAPMETVRLNLKTVRKEVAWANDDNLWTYTYNVDFPEDRFFVRKIELPAGTDVTVPDGWWRHDVEGRIFLHSYFYYPAHTVVPQVITYRLPR